MSTTPEPDPRSSNQGNLPIRRLTRLQQLTLTTWRHSSARVTRRVMPNDVLAHVAIQAVGAILQDTTDPLDLFIRHHGAEEEYALVRSLVGERSCDDQLDLLDSGFLLRWQELTSDGTGPEELPLLMRRFGPQRLPP